MNATSCHNTRLVWTLLLTSAALLTAPALAKTTRDADLQARYKQERAVCTSGQSNQARDTCLREAEAAYAQARRGGLDDGAATYAANQRQRCEALPTADRKACLARMDGQGSTSGSVAEGGVMRELVTVEPALPAPGKTGSGEPKPLPR